MSAIGDDLTRLAAIVAVLDDYTEPSGRIVVESYERVELRGEIAVALASAVGDGS